jgi:hypothetical protein
MEDDLKKIKNLFSILISSGKKPFLGLAQLSKIFIYFYYYYYYYFASLWL